MYTDFSDVYDALMADVDYAGWAGFYQAMMNAYGIRGGKVCECACGTGSLTLPLARAGFQLTGVDLSQEMLFRASTKARAAGLGIPFVQQDMRNLHLHRQMDAVLATCDGVNYLLTEDDAAAFFAAAWGALRPGGGLFFDVSTPYKLEHRLGSNVLTSDSPDFTYIWLNNYNPRTALLDLQVTIFARKPDGSYRRIDEVQRQRAWTREALTALLQQAGFSQVNVYGDRRPEAAHSREDRWHFAALKPAGAE